MPDCAWIAGCLDGPGQGCGVECPGPHAADSPLQGTFLAPEDSNPDSSLNPAYLDLPTPEYGAERQVLLSPASPLRHNALVDPRSMPDWPAPSEWRGALSQGCLAGIRTLRGAASPLR